MRREASSSSSLSSLSRSSSSHLQTQSHHHSSNFCPNDRVFPSDSGSNRFCLPSLCNDGFSSYFSYCSSVDGSPQFATPSFDGMAKHCESVVTADQYNHDLDLSEIFDLCKLVEDDDKTRYVRPEINHQTQRSNFGNYGFLNYTNFGVNKSPLFVYQKEKTPNSVNLGSESYNREPLSPFMNNHTMFHQRSRVGTLFDHQGSSSNTHTSVPKVSSELQGNGYLLAKDHHGCRFLQRIIEYGSALDAMIIFNDVIPHVAELMIDPFGNYLLQKLLDVCNEEQIMQIILMVISEPRQLVQISLNSYGTRVVQRLVESIKTKEQIHLVKSALRPGFLDLIKDLNGNRVIDRCLQCLYPEDNEFIFENATKFCIEIATHRHGCVGLQKCIARSSGQQREKLVSKISRNTLFLSRDPYGNYVVQYVLERGYISEISAILLQLKGHYVELSKEKCSSHVLERCLTHCPESHLQIVHELISVPHFDQLLQDRYANFVIKAALEVTEGSPLHATLVKVIWPYCRLRNSQYCKRIFSLIGRQMTFMNL